ncbi:MAG: bacteriohopanetetrol glucosamine biosynthesis glycosyltransferase HpnI [Terracidiphilus sp.]|jgi:ceramide glucosyltransferase
MTIGPIASLVLSALAVIGVITSTVYSLMVAISVYRFRRRAADADKKPAFQPPVSVLKPVHGDEPDLEENLASFFQQDYPDFELLFCARHGDDAGLTAARRAAARFPHVAARILTCGEPPWPNARTFSLEVMRRQARHPILVTSDSDVRVAPDYLASVVALLRDPKAGMVTCLYRGVARRGFWAQLEAMGMSVEMTSGVLVAEMLEGMRFALGPSIIMRQSTVEKIGGFEQVAQYYADDFVLGKWTAAAGETVVLSTYIVEHHVLNASFKKCIAHQQGWATSTRFSRPLGHLGEVLTYAVPYGLLALAVLGAAGHIALGLALLAITLLNRVLLCLLVAGRVVRDRAALRKAWLYPLRDFMGFCFWLRSYIGTRRVRYRGDLYELLPHGKLRKLTE